MKRAALFLLFGGLGVWGLLHVAGGMDGPPPRQPTPPAVIAADTTAPHTAPAPSDTDIAVGAVGGPPVVTSGGQNFEMMSKTQTLAWTDPATGDVMEIRGWFKWRFQAGSFEGLPRGDAATQGILCKDVVLDLYREPQTRAEAQRRIAGDLMPVLRQRFTASEARAFGSIAQKLNDRTGKRETSAGPDTRVDLLGDVVITDVAQGLRITGSQLRVHPVQERVEGAGKFLIKHEAMTLAGTTLTMERHERGWTRVEIRSKTSLHIHSDVGDEQGRPMFNFGTGEFRPTHVLSDGRAIFIREQGRREERLRLTFPDGVRAEQTGGRQLESGWLELLAVQDAPGTPNPEDDPARWTLRDLRCDGGVHVEYPSEATKKGERTFLTSITAERLTHIVPAEGRSRTELVGKPQIVARGQLPIDDAGSPEDRLHISCMDRAWIEPLTSAEVDAGLDASRMQRISLRGAARIERHSPGPQAGEDVLQGEKIDLLLLERPTKDGGSDTVAVQFSATGDVRLGGTRIRGHTQRLVAEGLHTPQPHIFAEGEGTTFTIPLLRRDQGLLGPDAPTPPDDAPAPAAGETTASDPATPKRVRWTLQRLLARGDVVVETQLGGASVGLPTRVTALEASYDGDQGLARLNGKAGAPVRVLSTVAPRETNLVEAQTISLDRARGVISARHGVRGELYMAERSGGSRSRARRNPSRALEMSVRTDARIDVHLVRAGDTTQPELNRGQRLSVQGPLVAELKSENLTVDRMRAHMLDVVLAAETPPAPKTRAAPPTTPTTRAQPPGRGGELPSARPQPRKPRTRVDVTASDVRVHLAEGEVSRLDASGGVTLKGRPGRVAGDRMTYDATTHRIEITAGTNPVQRPATAFLGTETSRTEIEGARLGLTWVNDEAQAADATAPRGRKARIRLFRKNPKTPGKLDRFELHYEDTIRLRADELTATNVILVRSVRDLRTRAVTPPAALYAKRLRVLGKNLLSRKDLTLTRMIADGERTYFRSQQSGKLVEAWGYRFDYDVATNMAKLQERGTAEVALKWGDNKAFFPSLLIDVAKGLPYAPDGTFIVLKGR